MRRDLRRAVLVHMTLLTIVSSCAILPYAHTLRFPFVFDDEQNIVYNPAVRVRDLSLSSLRKTVAYSGAWRRPIANLTFAVNFRYSGYRVRPYRVTNIMIHALNGVLVYALALLTIQHVRGNGRGRLEPNEEGEVSGHGNGHYLASAVAMVWALHPAHTQAVTYVVQRMTSLCVLFYLVALCLYLYARGRQTTVGRWSLFGGSLLAWILSIGCKEIAATLPLAVLLYEWLCFRSLGSPAFRRGARLLLIPVLIASLVLALLYLQPCLDWLMAAYSQRSFTLVERLLTQLRVVTFYVSLLFFPSPQRLNLDQHFPASSSFLAPASTFLSLLFLLGLVGLAVWCVRRDFRIGAFAVAWFFLHLAIESTVIPLEMAFDHRLYLPSIGVVLAVAYVARQHVPIPSRWRLALVVLLVGVLGVATWQRNSAWHSPLSVYEDAARKSPRKARPCYNAGLCYELDGDLAQATRHYEAALLLDPDMLEASYRLARLCAAEKRLDEAVGHYRRSLVLRPDLGAAWEELALLLRMQGRDRLAAFHFRQAVEFLPGRPGPHAHLAWLLATSPDDALRDGSAAVSLAEHACDLARHRVALYLAVAAAAYAENSQVGEALAKLGQARQALRRNERQSLVAALDEMHASFAAGRRFRSSALLPGAPTLPSAGKEAPAAP